MERGRPRQLSEPLSVAVNVGTAWRARTLFRLYAKGPYVGEAPAIPPLRTLVGGTYTFRGLGWARRATIGVTLEFDAEQTRRAPYDIPTGDYTLFGLQGEI